MGTFDEQALQAAYEKMVDGDVGPLSSLLAPDYVLDVTVWDLKVQGRDQAMELVRRGMDRFGVTALRIDRLDRHGDFVVACISGTSRSRGGDFQGVDVLLLDAEGRIAHTWVHRQPLDDAASYLGWQD